MATDCSQNIDPLKLVREGTRQDERAPAALAPAAAPVDARTVAHGIVFARDYARALRHRKADDTDGGDWSGYFGADAAVPLALASIEDVDAYRTRVREWFDFLGSREHDDQADALKERLGYLYAAIGALAAALDELRRELADDAALKASLAQLIATRLAPAFARLVAYYKGALDLHLVTEAAPRPPLNVLRREAEAFAAVLARGLSPAWSGGADWAAYVDAIAPDASVYGAGGAPDPFVRIHHCATHNLFRAIFDQFLKAFARTVGEAGAGLAETLERGAGHAPHYALYLAFLRLMAHVREAGNGLTRRHLDFYYATVLGLEPRPARPGHVHLLAELARQATQFDFEPGRLFKAGKDATGKPAFFANATHLVANRASVASLKSLYRHGAEPVADGSGDEGRLFASPVADSGDGQGGPPAAPDGSWQPFFNKRYVDGALAAIDMPRARVGFAVASHYLLAAEGARYVVVSLALHDALPPDDALDLAQDVQCLFTTAKGWLVKSPTYFAPEGTRTLKLAIEIDGADEAIVPYAPKVHGEDFDTTLPLLLVLLRQDGPRRYAYERLAPLAIDAIDLVVVVAGAKTLVASNDFGPVDLSKPFQPFGASPIKGSGFVVGSKELFQKQLSHVMLGLQWQVAPAAYPAEASAELTTGIDLLVAGSWTPSGLGAVPLIAGNGPDAAFFPWLGAAGADTTATSAYFRLGTLANASVLDAADFAPDDAYATSARHGYLRFRLDQDLGQDAYRDALVAYLRKDENADNPGPQPPQGPVAAALTLAYVASTTLALDSAAEAAFLDRRGRFFHVAPFGTAERHPYLNGGEAVPLLPPFRFARDGAVLPSAAEFYIGVAGLAPPQNLSLLFQVADGTANPLARKPTPHIHWSYLAHDRWLPFPENAVVDATGGLLDSGIVSFAVPREASADNRLMPSGQHWIRAAVHEASDAVCRLRQVAAQAMEAVFADRGNAPEFSSAPLPPGTVAQLAAPDAAVKAIAQPFPSFGGRGAERPEDFHRRVSERLRHKGRAIGLWDYERLVLEAFPQVYKVKCLNHTQYEPSGDDGGGPCAGGVYRELAPGHVTLVLLPDLRAQRQRDPLKPYASLGLLAEVRDYLARRCSGFARLHVCNPQFEEVRVAFSLKLRDGYDEAYSTSQLQAAITRFLSPWAFDGTGAPSFGGRVRKSALLHFVEEQACVDYIADLRLYRDVPCQAPGGDDLEEATGSRAVSILVSAPAGRHQITVIRPAPDPALAESCGCNA